MAVRRSPAPGRCPCDAPLEGWHPGGASSYCCERWPAAGSPTQHTQLLARPPKPNPIRARTRPTGSGAAAAAAPRARAREAASVLASHGLTGLVSTALANRHHTAR
jgi:hypothetical protein